MGDYCVITGTVTGTLEIGAEGPHVLRGTGSASRRGPPRGLLAHDHHREGGAGMQAGTAESRRRPMVGGIAEE